jgi:hypothetical protein
MTVCGVAGSLSGHEDVLHLCERRVLAEPFALYCILSSQGTLDVRICHGNALLLKRTLVRARQWSLGRYSGGKVPQFDVHFGE